MVRSGQFQVQVMKRVRKETRERRHYHLCKQQRCRLLLEKKVIEQVIDGLEHKLLHCKYISGQLTKEMCNVDIELRQRSLKLITARDLNSRGQPGISIPFVDYDFEVLRFALSMTMDDWIGSRVYFVYMLVSKHFRMVTRSLCPLAHDPQRCRLHVGSCVSSLALIASTTKRHHMRRRMYAVTGACTNAALAKWMVSAVHPFWILAGPSEMRSLHPSYPLANHKWLLVPHLPWEQLFDIFHIEPHGSFLSRRRRLKQLLINISSFTVNCRAALWRF